MVYWADSRLFMAFLTPCLACALIRMHSSAIWAFTRGILLIYLNCFLMLSGSTCRPPRASWATWLPETPPTLSLFRSIRKILFNGIVLAKPMGIGYEPWMSRSWKIYCFGLRFLRRIWDKFSFVATVPLTNLSQAGQPSTGVPVRIGVPLTIGGLIYCACPYD